MTNPLILHSRPFREVATIEQFLQSPDNKSFTELFLTFRPQLKSFFHALGCNSDLSDDLSQEVMLTVYQKSSQLRDRTRFRAWLFTIGRHALQRHYNRRSPEADSFNFDMLIDPNPPGSPAFEFHRWMTVLKPHESEALILRFVEQLEYHEIAAAQSIPVGTAQWRVFNAKKKLATRLRAGDLRKGAAA
jgi:RNA polymerase sigma-70 factor (ECF subfamily)